MIRFEKLQEDRFIYEGVEYTRAFPLEYYLAFDANSLIGFCRIDLMDSAIDLCLAKEAIVLDALRRVAFDFFQQTGLSWIEDRQSGERIILADALTHNCHSVPVVLKRKKEYDESNDN